MSVFLKYIDALVDITLELAPWLALGMFVAGLLHVMLPAGFIHRRFGGRKLSDVAKASALGVPLPLCSCGVIPAAIGLKKDGASNGAATGFLISTPQTGVDSIMVSASFLGWPFAVFKVVTALVMGLVGGAWVNYVERHDPIAPPPLTDSASGRKNGGFRGGAVVELFRFGFGTLLRDIYLWIVFGVAVAALISAVLPTDFFAGYPWLQGVGGMVLMLVISLPLYVCATSSVPIAAELIRAGLPMGSALVFLMAGPASNMATIGAIYKAFGRRVTVIYLATVILLSMAFGYLFQTILPMGGVGSISEHGHTLPHLVHVLFAVLITALFAWFALQDIGKWRRKRSMAVRQPKESLDKARLIVEGMVCQNCAGHVRRAIESRGARVESLDLKTGCVIVSGPALDAGAVTQGVTQAGYRVTSATAIAGD